MTEPRVKYISPLQNVSSAVGEIDFGKGLHIGLLPEQTLGLLAGFGRYAYQPWSGLPTWFSVSTQTFGDSRLVDGDPTAVLRLFQTALFLHFGEEARCGAMVELRSTDAQGETIPMVLIPRLAREGLFGPPNKYLIREADVVPLKTLFEQLVAATDAPLVQTLIRWFHKAVEDSALPADAVINLIVALEALFLDGDSQKAVALAERGAVFLGIDGPTREKHFVNLHALYRARNKVIHEGNEYPTVQLTTGRAITIVELQEYGFAYVRDALRKMLETPGQIKAELLSTLKKRVKPLKAELGGYRTTYFA